MANITKPPRFYRVKEIALGTRGVQTGTVFDERRVKHACSIGFHVKTWTDGDVSLRFTDADVVYFDPAWLTPVARVDEAHVVPHAVRRHFLPASDITPAALDKGTFVRIKCLYTDKERREALVGSEDPKWMSVMDATLGQLGVIVLQHTRGNYRVKLLNAHTTDVRNYVYNPGWFTVIADVALEVPRATAVLLGHPLVTDAKAAAAAAARKRVAEAVDTLERNTSAKIAALRASLAALSPSIEEVD
jgi:hypothetical protein